MIKLILFVVLLALFPGHGQETSGLQKKNTDGSSESSPRSMEDILEENAALKYQNRWLISIITKNISDLSNRIQNNSEEISSVRTDFDNATTHLSLAILDNTDHIDLVSRRVTTNEAHISTTNLRVDENKAYIGANENAIAENHDTIAVNHDAIAENENTIDGLETSVAKLLIKGAQCGYRYWWTAASSTITYEQLLLDTGRGSLKISSGVWESEQKGLYQVSWSLINALNSGDINIIYLYKNKGRLDESMHGSGYYSDGTVRDQGGRTMLLELDENDQLHLQTDTFVGDALYITFCVHLIAST